MDRIVLQGMVFKGRHGVSATERARPQPFRIDVELETDLRRAGRTDRIDHTVDYRAVRSIVKDVLEGETAHLIEALADRIARRTLAIAGVSAVSVRVAKQPASMRPIDAAAVHIRRSRR